MDKVQTHNLISTSDITGNIGTCETKQITATTKQGIVLSEKLVIMTNSCTGEVIEKQTYTDYGMVGFSIVLLILVIVFGLGIGLSLAEERNY